MCLCFSVSASHLRNINNNNDDDDVAAAAVGSSSGLAPAEDDLIDSRLLDALERRVVASYQRRLEGLERQHRQRVADLERKLVDMSKSSSSGCRCCAGGISSGSQGDFEYVEPQQQEEESPSSEIVEEAPRTEGRQRRTLLSKDALSSDQQHRELEEGSTDGPTTDGPTTDGPTPDAGQTDPPTSMAPSTGDDGDLTTGARAIDTVGDDGGDGEGGGDGGGQSNVGEEYITRQDYDNLQKQFARLKRALKCVDLQKSNGDDLVFSGCNVHIRNGKGQTEIPNSKGNLVRARC